MTYPPQPGQPYGHQPDPYGQGGQPPSGGFPQQGNPQYPGQQHPQQGGYGQQQYPGYDQQQYGQTSQYGQEYVQGFGGPPMPPKKGKTGLLIGIVVGLVVLVAVGVTGFVAPGFFLSQDNNAGSGGPVGGVPSSSPTSRSSAPTSTSRSRSSAPTSTSKRETPSTGDGAAVIQQFVDKVNAKDEAGATSLVCSGSEATTSTYIYKATSSDSPAITATPTGSGNFINADVGGTYNGKEANGIVFAQNTAGTFCISGFIVY
jgi:hypothetical protein